MKSNQTKVSVVIPFYKSEKYIRKCIESVTNQTYKNIEIIFVDDGSFDGSLAIVKEAIKNDKRIKLISSEHKGVSVARNIGINAATGKFLTFLDSDDELDCDGIEKLINLMTKHNTSLVIGQMRIKKNNKFSYLKVNKIADKKYNIESLFLALSRNKKLIERANSVTAKMYKLDIIRKHNIKFEKKLKIGEDLVFNLQYLKYIKNVYFSSKIVYSYLADNMHSITHSYTENKYEQLMYISNQYAKFINKLKCKKLRKCCKYIEFKNIRSCLKDFCAKGCRLSDEQKYLRIKKMKQEHPKIVVCGMGFFIFVESFVYSVSGSRFLKKILD